MRPIKIFRKKKLLGGFTGRSIWPFIIISRKSRNIQWTENHEKTHHVQWEVLWIIGFAIQYTKFHRWYGYRHNPFEIEAYRHAHDPNYWKTREKHGWKKYHGPEFQGDKYRG
jgi:hypothetical protein